MANDFLKTVQDYAATAWENAKGLAEKLPDESMKLLDGYRDYAAKLTGDSVSKDAPLMNFSQWVDSQAKSGVKFTQDAAEKAIKFYNDNAPDEIKNFGNRAGGFLDNNKGALGGMAVLGLLGMMLMGGGMGAILMALVGLLAGAALMDKGNSSILGGMFTPETPANTPGGTTPAQDAPAASKQTEIMIGLDGKIVSKAEEAEVVIKGKFAGEVGKEQFIVENASLRGKDGALKELDLGKEPLILDAKNITEITSEKNRKIIGMRLDKAMSGANPAAAPAPQPTSPEATPPQPAPTATAAPQTPAATTQPSGNAPLEARGPVRAPLMAGAAAATPNVDLTTLYTADNRPKIPELLRMQEPANAAVTTKAEKSTEAGSASYSITTKDGDIARSATFGITKNGRFVDPSKADVLISGINNMDGTFTLTSAAARNERGEFPKVSPGSDQVMLTTITGKSKDQLTLPLQENKLNADETKTQFALLVTASDEMSRQGAINNKAVEERNAKLDAITKEALERQVANVNKDKAATLVRTEDLPNGTVYTFVQSGMLNNGERYNFKFQGRFETVAAEGGLGSATQRLVIDRGNFVDSPDAPIGSQSLINKDKPYVMNMTTLGEDGKTLVGDSRNLSYMRDDTSPTKLSINYLTGLKAMSSQAAFAPPKPATTLAGSVGASR
ncbi:MAG: hypothetical protein SFW63_01390 [Alphaproteobacteria bacterium]|nr:hypothetical protein [Alphaproteobacteria bacterium]